METFSGKANPPKWRVEMRLECTETPPIMGDTSGLSPIISVPNRLRFLYRVALALWLAAALLSSNAQAGSCNRQPES